jgi:hypothetical protein
MIFVDLFPQIHESSSFQGYQDLYQIRGLEISVHQWNSHKVHCTTVVYAMILFCEKNSCLYIYQDWEFVIPSFLSVFSLTEVILVVLPTQSIYDNYYVLT